MNNIYDYLILTLGEISNFSNILYKLVLLFFFLVVEAVYASVNYEGYVCTATEQTNTGKWALIL